MGFLQQITGGGNIIPGVDNPFQSGKTVWLPGAGGLNPLNSQSAVGQLTKDLGALNPYNPDSVAGKVVDNIGKDMAKDPAKWVAIAACIATGQVQFIPYINAIATVTSKETSPEDWLKEGAKAYVISAGGEWVSNNVTGVGPQTDITTGETFAGTGASGAMNSAKAGAVAGNISRNIFSTAARKGSTDINSAQIVTGAITNEALNEAFKFMPGFDGLTKGEQSATVNAFKTAFNKDSNAAYQLFNQGFDATIKGLNDAAKAVGYKDLNQQNAVNNFVQDQGSTEDIEAFNRIEKDAQDKYDNYVSFQDKQKAFDAAQKEYIAAKGQYDYYNGLLTPGPGRYKVVGVASWQNARDAAAATMNAANKTMGDNRVQPEVLQQANDEYANARTRSLDNVSTINTYIEEGWDNLSQKTKAEDLGLTTPRDYDVYLLDQRIAQISKDNGFDSVEQMQEAGAVGISTRAAYDAYKAEEANQQARAKAQADEQAAIDAEVAAQAQAQADSQAQAQAQADAQAAIDAEVAAQAQAQADAQAAIDAETAKATQEAQEAEEQARRVAEFGKDLTGGGNQDLGEVDTDTDFYDKDSTGMGAYKYDPTSGTYTYTSDDGSTLTLDGEGAIVGVTESTDTPWTGITDTKTGNLKLPKLPSGKVPVIPATAVKPTKPPVTPPAEPDPLAAILGQQQTPVTYQTVMPELAKVFYGGQDFSSTPQRLNEQGQLEQQNPLLKEPNFVDPTKPLEKSFAGPQQTLNAQGQLAQRYSLLDEPNFLDPTKPLASSALAPQGNPKENDVAAMLTKIMGGRGNPTSQEELLKILGRA